MKFHNIIAVAVLSLSIPALADWFTGPKTATMNTTDLNYFRTDCAHKQEQMAFLLTQRANAPFWDTRKRAEINYYIRFMQATCGETASPPSGCVVVRENFGPSPSQAVVCRDNHFKGPIVNRWETEVDN